MNSKTKKKINYFENGKPLYSEWCVINKTLNKITFFTNTIINHSPLEGTVLVRTQAWIDNKGILYIKGDKVQYKYVHEKTNIKELEKEPVKSDIKHFKGNKWFGIKPMDYVQYWYKLKETKESYYVFSDYIIEILD